MLMCRDKPAGQELTHRRVGQGARPVSFGVVSSEFRQLEVAREMEQEEQLAFALGLERWVARMVGATNVRETRLFARDLSRLTP